MKQKKNRPLLLAGAICLLSLVAMVLALTLGGKDTVTPFTPPPFDETAQVGTPEVPENLGWGELDAKVFKASVCGVFAPSDGKVDVYLTNPETNTVWLKLRVLDTNGNILGETGLVKPGEYVQSVTLTTTPKTGAKIVLKLMAYEPETYHSAGAVSLETTVSES